MKVEVLRCPNCNSSINDENMSFCPYCGSKLFVDDGTRRIEYNKTVTINKNISNVSRDEAKIRKAELRDQQDRRSSRMSLIMFGSFVLLVLFAIAMLYYEEAKEEKAEAERLLVGVYLQTPAKKYEGRDHQLVVSELEGLGFTNIQVKPIQAGLFKKEGAVERISINGDSEFKENAYFRKDAPVIITYYKKDK